MPISFIASEMISEAKEPARPISRRALDEIVVTSVVICVQISATTVSSVVIAISPHIHIYTSFRKVNDDGDGYP